MIIGDVIAATELVSRQVVHCHRVLRAVQSVAEKSTTINSKTWDALLRFLLAVNDVLLAPPTEKGPHCLAFYSVVDCCTDVVRTCESCHLCDCDSFSCHSYTGLLLCVRMFRFFVLLINILK